MNLKMVKSEMRVLTERENIVVVNADVVVDWKLQFDAGTIVGEREKDDVA
jgi:hypothetical protein